MIRLNNESCLSHFDHLVSRSMRSAEGRSKTIHEQLAWSILPTLKESALQDIAWLSSAGHFSLCMAAF